MPGHKPLPNVPEMERSALVDRLFGQIEQPIVETRRQAELIQQPRTEIAALKGEKAKPKFTGTGMEAATETPDEKGVGAKASGKCPGSAKRSKSQELTIHETIKVAPRAPLRPYSRFRG
jgi:hypothetical protein